jgi:hypothetical protein
VVVEAVDIEVPALMDYNIQYSLLHMDHFQIVGYYRQDLDSLDLHLDLVVADYYNSQPWRVGSLIYYY